MLSGEVEAPLFPSPTPVAIGSSVSRYEVGKSRLALGWFRSRHSGPSTFRFFASEEAASLG